MKADPHSIGLVFCAPDQRGRNAVILDGMDRGEIGGQSNM
jgi:hypothetical protein